MKKCPYCAEEIQDEAIKCKHCGEIVGIKSKKCTHCGTENNIDAFRCKNEDCTEAFKSTDGGIVYESGKMLGEAHMPKRKSSGNYSCPKCGSGNTDCKRAIGCLVMILIFVSLGIGLIMIPFLPYHCECRKCGHKWKT